jgi:hypothetical protein
MPVSATFPPNARCESRDAGLGLERASAAFHCRAARCTTNESGDEQHDRNDPRELSKALFDAAIRRSKHGLDALLEQRLRRRERGRSRR